MEWFYSKNGEQLGPVSTEEFDRLVSTGDISAKSLVWKEGMVNWQSLEALRPEMADPSAPPPPVPPPAPSHYAAPPAVPAALRYAGIGVRFVALLIDTLIVWAVIGLVVFLDIFSLGIFSQVLVALGMGWMTGTYGATPGKMAMSLQVVDAAGKKLPMPQAIGREIVKIVSGMILLIGYIVAFFDDRKRTLHDRVVGSFVVKA
jgi:uncharacterized RDD family membrane protein YckC